MPSTREVQWDLEQVERFWDYQSTRPSLEQQYFSVGYGRQIVARTLRWLPRRAGRILDLGCGPGYLLRHLHARVGTRHALVGADTSPRSVQRARKLCEGLNPSPVVQGIAGYPTPFADGSFDAIYSVEVVEHLPDEVLELLLDDVFRILAPSGIFVVTTPNAEDLEVLHTLCPACNSTFHIWQHVRSWNTETLAACLSRKGFDPLQVVATRFEPRLVRFAFWAARKFGMTSSRAPHLLGVFRKPT